jgi:phage-related protein
MATAGLALLALLGLVAARNRASRARPAGAVVAPTACYEIRTATTEAGEKPVERWIRRLDADARAEVIGAVDLLEQQGPNLEAPHAHALEEDLYELRARLGGAIHRILYMPWQAKTFVLLHGFTKRSSYLARQDLETAKERRAVWFAREKLRDGGFTGAPADGDWRSFKEELLAKRRSSAD